jgi:hypothetical protein
MAVITGYSKILLTSNEKCFIVTPYAELDGCFRLFLFLVYRHAPGVLFVPIGKTKAMGAKPMAFLVLRPWKIHGLFYYARNAAPIHMVKDWHHAAEER